jgi:hypothetical protein
VSKKPRKTSHTHPTRIHELAAERGWTYQELASRISALAAKHGDMAKTKVHYVSVHRLASGKTKLTSEWMDLFAEVFGVPLEQITEPPPPKGLLRVPVTMTFEGGKFREANTIPEAEQYDAIVEIGGDEMGQKFYAGEIRGDGANLRWPNGTSLILSRLQNLPGESVPGKRYHVRRRLEDGLAEDSIRLMVERDGAYWLVSESDRKEHQQALRLPSEGVELVGKVRWSLASE